MKTKEQTIQSITDEIAELIHSEIEYTEGSTFEDLFFDLFNSDYYIIGTYQAKEWLTDMDALNCVEIVTEWEEECLGERHFKDFTNYEKLVSITVYSVADSYMNDMLWELDVDRDDEITPELIDSVQNYIAENDEPTK